MMSPKRKSVASCSGWLVVTLIGIISTLASLSTEHVMKSKIEEENPPAVVRPLYNFGGKLLIEINKQNGTRNVILSPLSLHQALGMVLLGSKDKSRTRRELLDTIGYSNMSENEINNCHQDHAKIMSDFSRINNETLNKRQEFEAKKKGEQSLILSQLQPRSPILDVFNTLVTKGKSDLIPAYESSIKKYYHASIGNIDDKVPETKSAFLKKLTDWAKEAGFAQPIMSKDYLDKDFEAILLSAIRVEAFWFDEFHEMDAKQIFYNFGSKDKPVHGKVLSSSFLKGSHYIEFTSRDRSKMKNLHDRMSKHEAFKQLSGLNLNAIDIPLQGGLSFSIFETLVVENGAQNKPNAKLVELVEKLFSKYDNQTAPNKPITKLDKILELFEHSGGQNQIDEYSMPKFKFESDIDLKPVLKSLGLRRPFDRERSEITKITKNSLSIDDIKHKAMIETTKVGIKAVGVTIIKLVPLSAVVKEDRIVVEVKNPFMFLLRYKKIPLFLGQLTNLS